MTFWRGPTVHIIIHVVTVVLKYTKIQSMVPRVQLHMDSYFGLIGPGQCSAGPATLTTVDLQHVRHQVTFNKREILEYMYIKKATSVQSNATEIFNILYILHGKCLYA